MLFYDKIPLLKRHAEHKRTRDRYIREHFMAMHSYFAKMTENSDRYSDRYICVNNFGYNDGILKMNVRRDSGRADFQLIYVGSGCLTVYENDAEISLREGSVCLFRPREPQRYSVTGEQTTFYWIHFSGREAENMLSFFEQRSYSVGGLPEFERYCRTFLLDFKSEDQYSELFCEGKLIALIARIAQCVLGGERRSTRAQRLRPAIEAMRLDGAERLSNEELASLVGISKYHFIKLFKEVTGVTPLRYYTELAVDKAKYLLANTTYTVSEVARLCGIEDGFYFSRMFKKHTGSSPNEYRKNPSL